MTRIAVGVLARTTRAELRKLVHPVVMIVLAIVLMFIAVEAHTTFLFARRQAPTAVVASARIAADAATCAVNDSVISVDCQRKLETLALNDSFAANGIALGRVNNSLSTWPGLLRFVTHHLATGIGAILLSVLLGIHVAGEWSSRTAASSLLASGSYGRFWLAKVISTWLAMLGTAVLGTTVLYLARPAYLGLTGIPAPIDQPGDPSTWRLATLSPDPHWSSWATSLGELGTVSLLWMPVIIAGAAVAGLLRRTVPTIVIGLGGLSGAVLLTQTANGAAWSPVSVVDRILSLQRTPFGVRDTQLWSVPGAPGFIQDTYHPAVSGLGHLVGWVVLLGVVAAAAGVLSLRRRVAA